jgi:hypothetical protein
MRWLVAMAVRAQHPQIRESIVRPIAVDVIELERKPAV